MCLLKCTCLYVSENRSLVLRVASNENRPCIEDTKINNLASALLGGSPGHSDWSGADCKGTYIYAGPLPMDGGKEAVELAIVG